MPTVIPGRLSTHRMTAIVRFQCYADSRYFGVWTDVPEELKDELEAHNGLPCGDSVAGEPGWWCRDCRFGETEELAVIPQQRRRKTYD